MARSKFPWLKLTKKSQPEPPEHPPIWLGSRSNGEYFHQQTKREHAIQRLVMERADAQSRRLGIDRREFLASSMGMFTTLAAINQVSGCGGDNGDGTTNLPIADAGNDGGGPNHDASAPSDGGSGPECGDCPYVVPVEATCEETDLLEADGQFIFDAQTHSFDDGEWRELNDTYSRFLGLLAMCGDDLDCFDEDHYGRYMFVESDTTVSVITSWPAKLCEGEVMTDCGLPLSNEGMRKLRDSINEKLRSQRVVNQIQVMPNDRWELQRDVMTMAAQDPAWQAVSWKAYPAWGPPAGGGAIGGPGYFLTSELGTRFIEHGLALGIPNFAIHKGLPIPGFNVENNQPIEIGEIATAYPEANFIIYHSGIGANGGQLLSLAQSEDIPFDESVSDPRMHTGVNQLIAAVREAGITPENNTNVFGELGSAWSNVMNDANAAQHLIGKLLKYLGEDHVVWGSDCILYGSPQPQIEAFRRFQITPQFQEQYGYPALSERIKTKIFGQNAARIFRIDPAAGRCAAEESTFARVRRQLDGELGKRRWVFQKPLGPTTRREFLALARQAIAKGTPGA